MATKTISIDLQAYGRLKAAKLESESFSDVIKRVVPARVDAAAWFREVSRIRLSREATDAIEQKVRERRIPSRRTRKWPASIRPA